MKKASDFDQELLNLFDQYVHGGIDRRGFLDRAGKFAVGGMTAGDAARRAQPALRRGPAGAQGRRADQGGISAEYPSPHGLARRCAAIWSGRQRRPASCPASWWSTRTAASTRTSRTSPAASRSTNFVAFAPDALAPLGGYPGDEDKARELFAKLDQAKTREDFVAAAEFLQSAPRVQRARSARSASATAAASSTCWPRGCPTSARGGAVLRQPADGRGRRRRSRRRC